MKYLMCIITMLFATNAFAEPIYDEDSIYSGLGLKCTSEDVKVYIGAKGRLLLRGENTMTLKMFSDKFDTNVLSEGIEKERNLFGSWGSEGKYSWSFSDPYNFEYRLELDHASFFQNGAESEATLRRHHEHPQIDVDTTYTLSCTTTVTIEKIELNPFTQEIFLAMDEWPASAILAEATGIGHWDLEELYDQGDFSAEDQMLYQNYAETVKIYNLDDRDEQLPDSFKTYAQELDAYESKMNDQCIDDFFDDWGSDLDRDEILDNWNVCSYTIYIAADVEGKILGAVVVRYNDNGTDEGDGHDGAVLVYDMSKKNIMHYDWEN